jgi:hypothetical protein
MMRATVVAIALAAALGAGAAIAQTQPSPQPAQPAPAASAAPAPAPADSDAAGSSPAQPAPQPSATPAYRYVWVPKPTDSPTPYPGPNAPQIREIDLGDQTLVTPGELRVRVLTSPQVVAVTARTLGREIGIPQQTKGVFALAGMVPAVPRFLTGRTYDVDFTAATADGRTTTVTLPLGLE